VSLPPSHLCLDVGYVPWTEGADIGAPMRDIRGKGHNGDASVASLANRALAVLAAKLDAPPQAVTRGGDAKHRARAPAWTSRSRSGSTTSRRLGAAPDDVHGAY